MYRIRLYIVPERPELDEEVDGSEEGTSLVDDEEEDAGFWSSGDSDRSRRPPSAARSKVTVKEDSAAVHRHRNEVSNVYIKAIVARI